MKWATYQGARSCTGREQPGMVALMIALEEWITDSLRDLKRFKVDNLVKRRYEKFRSMGQYELAGQ